MGSGTSLDAASSPNPLIPKKWNDVPNAGLPLFHGDQVLDQNQVRIIDLNYFIGTEPFGRKLVLFLGTTTLEVLLLTLLILLIKFKSLRVLFFILNLSQYSLTRGNLSRTVVKPKP